MDDIVNTTLDLLNFEYFARILLPGKCYKALLKNWEITNVTCLKILVSKCLGYGIIIGSILVKVPQIVKMVNARSGQGINLGGVTLELIASMSTLCYGYNQAFPFSAYGESISMSFQTCLIGVLILYYSRQYYATLLYLLAYVVSLAFLLSPMAHSSLLWFLQAMVIPNVILGRSLQVLANYRAGHTGQLSAITATLLVAGSLARVFTTWVETRDFILTATFVISFITNGAIFLQIVYYRDVTLERRKMSQRKNEDLKFDSSKSDKTGFSDINVAGVEKEGLRRRIDTVSH